MTEALSATTLPTSDIALVAFLTISYVGTLVALVRYFLSAQRSQTRMYMEYIETKNGHLAQVTKEHREMVKGLISEITHLRK